VRRALFPLVRLVRGLRPDVIVPNLGYLNLLLLAARAAAAAQRADRADRAHDPVGPRSRRRARPGLWNAAYRVLYPRADRIVACSHAIADDLVTSFGVASRASA